MVQVRSIVFWCLIAAHSARAASITLDFEGIADSTTLTTEYAGFTFADLTVLTAGVNLNDAAYPPHSGDNAAASPGSPVVISFAIPVLSFGGYFTYASALTIEAFDSLNQSVGTANSNFALNYVSSGNPPNEFIQASFAGGIASIVISGGAFALDDLTVTTPDSTSIPEPSTLFMTLSVFLLAARYRRK